MFIYFFFFFFFSREIALGPNPLLVWVSHFYFLQFLKMMMWFMLIRYCKTPLLHEDRTIETLLLLYYSTEEDQNSPYNKCCNHDITIYIIINIKYLYHYYYYYYYLKYPSKLLVWQFHSSMVFNGRCPYLGPLMTTNLTLPTTTIDFCLFQNLPEKLEEKKKKKSNKR